MTHAEPSAPVRLEPTDPGSDVGLEPRTGGVEVARHDGSMDAGSAPAPAEGRKAQRSSAQTYKIKIL